MVDKAADTPGAALAHAYQRKDNQSRDACLQEGIAFIPIPVGALGGFHNKIVETICKLAKQPSKNTQREESLVINHLFERLSIQLMKGNSALFTSRAPALTPSLVDGERQLKVTQDFQFLCSYVTTLSADQGLVAQ